MPQLNDLPQYRYSPELAREEKIVSPGEIFKHEIWTYNTGISAWPTGLRLRFMKGNFGAT